MTIKAPSDRSRLGRVISTSRGRDDGLTLAETLVAMGMSAVVMLALGTMFIGSLRENRTVIAKTNTTGDARIALEATTRELRVATVAPGQPAAIVSATATSVSFYSSIGASTQTTDPKPSLITLRADTTNHCLWREITPATVVGTTWTWPTANKKAGCVARGNVNVSGTDLFTYYPLAADDTISTTAYTSGQLASNLGSIASVGISLSLTDPANPSVAPTTLQDQVTLINVATALGN